MTFISYAQNYEDFMLWRALKHIKAGFYIDVGANDPEIESVTKAFYDYGWQGINIEPVLSHYEALLEKRPRDINLLCAVGDKRGEIEIFNCDVRGWATGVTNIADRYIKEGHQGRFNRVSMHTLEDICKEFVSRDIHFLKIDVEGFEKEVIIGADFERYRPWIVVVEATRPNSTEEVYGEWEPILFKANYLFVYADGLNRFYIAKENSQLIPSFQYPPNVFDEFIRIDQLNAQINARHFEGKAKDSEKRAIEAEAIAQEAAMRAEQAEARAIDAELQIAQTETKSREAIMRVEQAEARAQEAIMRAEQAEAKSREATIRVEQAEAKSREATIQAEHAEKECNRVYFSYSWRITAPLRWVKKVAHSFLKKSKAWASFAPETLPYRIIRSVVIYFKSKI